eukprot:4716128-Amphidinium_carterae.1
MNRVYALSRTASRLSHWTRSFKAEVVRAKLPMLRYRCQYFSDESWNWNWFDMFLVACRSLETLGDLRQRSRPLKRVAKRCYLLKVRWTSGTVDAQPPQLLCEAPLTRESLGRSYSWNFNSAAGRP